MDGNNYSATRFMWDIGLKLYRSTLKERCDCLATNGGHVGWRYRWNSAGSITMNRWYLQYSRFMNSILRAHWSRSFCISIWSDRTGQKSALSKYILPKEFFACSCYNRRSYPWGINIGFEL